MCQMDGHTDEQDYDSQDRASIAASRVKNEMFCINPLLPLLESSHLTAKQPQDRGLRCQEYLSSVSRVLRPWPQAQCVGLRLKT